MQTKIAIILLLLVLTIGLLGYTAAQQACGSGLAEECVRSELAMRDRTGLDVFNVETESSVFVGGQNGTWFKVGQYPRLYQVSLQTDSFIQLDPVLSGGTVWGGGFSGSQLLVSGWGTDDASQGPYVWIYNGAQVVAKGSLDDFGQALSWNGGDVFAASYNGTEWLLSGLGSGTLSSFGTGPTNHMALGTFNGSVFTDLSGLIPEQQDAILYANAWNGRYWLVGGGYMSAGVLFAYDGNRTVDLTAQIVDAVPSFASVQALAWNGEYWLIGGIGFVAKYDGHSFVDLTQRLKGALKSDFRAVNAIAWNGKSWVIGGGTPIAQTIPSNAWLASFDSADFVNLSSLLPSYVNTEASSILSITAANGMWILGGYSGSHGILFAYEDGRLTDYSSLVRQFTYVDWVFAT